MVVKIMRSTGSMKNPLDYNEKKVKEKHARVVGTANADLSNDTLRGVFGKLEKANIRSRNVSFHMSINPAPGELRSDEDVRRFTGELMERLGYKDQPFVIYEHSDISRRHYHVVSIRTTSSGRKVRDFCENRNCLRIIEELSKKYGFTVGPSPDGLQNDAFRPMRFDPYHGGTYMQVSSLINDCLTYRFTSMDQFRLLMKCRGVRVGQRTPVSERLVFQGLDRKGKPCTDILEEKKLELRAGELCRVKIAESLRPEGLPLDALREVDNIHLNLAAFADSEHHYRSMMAKKGIITDIHRGEDGRISGITFIDRVTHCVFNSTELPGFSLSDIRLKDANDWIHEEVKDNGKDHSVQDVLSFLSELAESCDGGNTMSSSKTEEKEQQRRRRKTKRRR